MDEVIKGADKKSAPFSNIDTIKFLLNKAYGEENVDFQLNSPDKYTVLILFPEVKVVNDKQESHIMKDLYIGFNLDKNGILLGNYFKMTRGKLTYAEYKATYVFSHANNRYNSSQFGSNINIYSVDEPSESNSFVTSWAHCCYGVGHIASTLSQLSNKFSINNWQMFINELNVYISYEDLNGGPYTHISRIRRNSEVVGIYREYLLDENVNLNQSTFNDLLEKLFPVLQFSANCQPGFIEPILITPISEIEKIITQYYIEKQNYSELLYKGVDGHYYRSNAASIPNSNLGIPLGFKFKEKQVHLYVDDDSSVENIVWVVKPWITVKIVSMLLTFAGINITNMNFYNLNQHVNQKEIEK